MKDTDFISKDNKAMIWQLLMEANAFVNIPDHYFDNVKTMYEKFINEISELSNLNLKQKNKLIMSKMFENIKYYANESIQKPLQEVKIRVEEQFKNKQEEFIQLVNHNKPKDLSFNEKSDEPFDSEELNTKLNQMIAARSYDLVDVTQDTQDISKNNVNETNVLPNSSDSISMTVTENNENGENGENGENKKVTFLPTSESILSKLKPLEKIQDFSEKPDINKDIYEILQTISMNLQLTLKNQDMIIKLINKNLTQ